MNYSVQQIKFECFNYIKAFGARMDEWAVGATSDPERTLFDRCGVDRSADVWLWKPAQTAAAATAVIDFLTARYRLQRISPPAPEVDARFVILYRTRVTARL